MSRPLPRKARLAITAAFTAAVLATLAFGSNAERAYDAMAFAFGALLFACIVLGAFHGWAYVCGREDRPRRPDRVDLMADPTPSRTFNTFVADEHQTDIDAYRDASEKETA